MKKISIKTFDMQKRNYQAPHMEVLSLAAVPVLNSISGNGMYYGGYDDSGEGD